MTTMYLVSDTSRAPAPSHGSVDALMQDFQAAEALEYPDVLAPLKSLRLTEEGTLQVPDLGGALAFNDWTRRQVSALVGVKWDRWFAAMSPAEQADEVNKRLTRSEQRMRVRATRSGATPGTLGTLRAIVSQTFSPLPDSSLLAVLRSALEPVEPDIRVVRSDVTDMTATYVLGLGRPVRPGDDKEVGDVWGGLLVRNSGVGFAAAMLIASFTRLLCKNGMTAPLPNAVLLRRAHRAFDLEKLKDALIERLRELPGRLREGARVLVASRDHRVPDPRAAFLDLLRRAHLPQRLLPDLERAYEAEPGLQGAAFGISQAATRAAQTLSPEERVHLEQAAGEYLASLSRTN